MRSRGGCRAGAWHEVKHMRQYLTDWTLCGYYNYTPILERSMETGAELQGVIQPVPARVPCSVYEPLIDGGIIPDPYFECNSRLCEWVAARFWVYETEFIAEKTEGARRRLVFEGLDCKCDIWLNNVLIAHSDNMYVPVYAEADGLLRPGANKLKVMFYNAPDEMGQAGYTSKVKTQKARFYYKWDFCARLPQIGIYRPVYLEQYYASAHGFDIRTDMHGGLSVRFAYDCTGQGGAECRARLTQGGQAVLERTLSLKESGAARFTAKIKDVKLWDCDNPVLYRLALSFESGGMETFTREFDVGFKTLKVMQNEGAAENAPPYLFELNGKKTYIKGVNLTPADMLYGRITKSRLEKLLADVKNVNANLVRVWGGGFIESEDFYDICDRTGLLVWQDFIQSSSGIDNHPSGDKEFTAKFMDTVKAAVAQKRNHACTAVFCGGNEIAEGPERKPVDESNKLIERVARYVRGACDVHFVGTTPGGARFAAEIQAPEDNHDVHAPWLYLGDPGHYGYANSLRCLFHGEFGCNAMSPLVSLQKFLSPENIGVFSYSQNPVWRHHGGFWDTCARDKGMFGDSIKDVGDMIEASQFVQAEALKYIVEADRRGAFYNGGVMVWCFNEPYPNVSNQSLIDYYGERKAAYYQIKKCFEKNYASLTYEKLVYAPGEKLSVLPYAISCADGKIELKVSVTGGGQTLAEQSFTARAVADAAVYFERLEFIAPASGAMWAELKLLTPEGTHTNRIMLLVSGRDGKADAACAAQYNAWLKEEENTDRAL